MVPWSVAMLTLMVAGSVGTRPVFGAVTGLAAFCAADGYWQLAPRSAAAVKAGS